MTIVSSPMPAGEQLRFRVADDQGRFGSSWTVRTSRSNGDVVVSHREAGGWVHATFHAGPPGEWHFALTPSGSERPPDEPRYVGVLRNPDEVAPGWRHAMRISVPTDELRANWVERAAVRPLVSIRPWDAFDAASIDILLGCPIAVRPSDHSKCSRLGRSTAVMAGQCRRSSSRASRRATPHGTGQRSRSIRRRHPSCWVALR